MRSAWCILDQSHVWTRIDNALVTLTLARLALQDVLGLTMLDQVLSIQLLCAASQHKTLVTTRWWIGRAGSLTLARFALQDVLGLAMHDQVLALVALQRQHEVHLVHEQVHVQPHDVLCALPRHLVQHLRCIRAPSDMSGYHYCSLCAPNKPRQHLGKLDLSPTATVRVQSTAFGLL